MENEEIYRRINDHIFVIRTIERPRGKGTRAQYRFFLLCTQCRTRTRLQNGNAEINHTCTQSTQTTLEQYGTGIDHTLFIQCQFVAKTNLSMRMGSSPHLYDFMKTVFIKGQQSILNLIPQSLSRNLVIPNFEKYYRTLARSQFTEEFVRIAEAVKTVRMSNYRNMIYVSFSIDAGTINGVPILDVLLTNPWSKQHPVIWAARTHFRGTTNDYKDVLKEVFSKIEFSYSELIFSAIVCDNLSAQLGAIDPRRDTSFQKENRSTHKSIFFQPCACHTAALGFNDFIKNNQMLSNIQTIISNYVHYFRSKPIVAYIQQVCPKFCMTRWTNLFDICHWFLKNKDTIISLFTERNEKLKIIENFQDFCIFFFDYVPLLYFLLYSYKAFISILEADSTPACYIYPLLIQFRDETIKAGCFLDSHGFFNAKEAATSLVQCINARFIKHYGVPYLKMIYHLTPYGRIEYREELAKSNYPIDNDGEGILKPEQIPNITVGIEEFVKEYSKFIENQEQDKATVSEGIFFHTHRNRSQCIDEEVEDDEFEEGKLGSDDEDSNDDQTPTDLDCEMSDIDTFLKQRAIFLGNEAVSIVSRYNRWITESLTHMSMISAYDLSPWKFWKIVERKVPEYRYFASFVLRHLSVPSSSSACERLLYRQNRIIPPERANTSEKLMIARILMSTSSERDL